MSPKIPRPQAIQSITIKLRTDGCGDVYTTITIHNGRCFEIFVSNGKAGGCFHATGQAFAEMTSRALRSGMDVEEVIHTLMGHACFMGPNSCMSRIGIALKAVKIHLQSGMDIEAALEQAEEEGVHHV